MPTSQKKITNAIIIGLLGGITIPIMIAFGPLVIGAARVIQNTRLWLLRAKENPPSDYHYRPTVSPLKQTLLQTRSIVATLLTITLFPLYLWGLGIHVLLGFPIYPKAFLNPFKSLRHKSHQHQQEPFPLIRDERFIVKEFRISMPNGVQLQSCDIRHKDTKDTNDTPHIIYFGGNGNTFSSYEDLVMADALALKAHVIGFHHSSFGRSGVLMANGDMWHKPASSHRTFVEEGIAQVQRLLDNGVRAEHITLYGHSLGGTIAADVAYHFHHLKTPQRIYVFNDRSLTTPTAMVTGKIHPDKPTPQTPWLTKHYVRIGLSWLLKPIIKITVMLTGWDFDAASFAKIPKKYREYLVARGKTDQGNILTDDVIPDSASVRHLRAVKKEYKAWKKAQPAKMSDNPHKFYKVKTDEPISRHNVALSEFAREDGVTGQDYWHAFVRR